MDFFLLVLLTAIMMIRPEEIFTDLTGAHLYLWASIITAIAAAGKLRHLFTADELARRSIAVCVLGFYASLIASAALSGKRDVGQEYCEEFFKVVSYYFLLIAIIDTPDRLRHFLGWLVVLVAGVALVATLHYYEIVNFPLLPKTIVEKRMDPETGEAVDVKRALASGIFGDPNDLCLILVLGMLCCLYQASATRAASARLFWLLAIVPLFLVLSLTGSRGGMLGLLAGFATIVYAFFGFRIGLPMAAAGALALLAIVGGRASELSGGGTAHERLSLWGDGLINLFRYPISIPFGLGPGWYQESHGLLAHNSFINAYVEVGLLGGGFFLMAFVTALWLTDRAGQDAPLQPWARTMKPMILGILVAYAAGCFSLSRHLVLPTYLVLGLATAYINLIGEPPPRHVVSSSWFRWAFVVMVAGLAALKLFTQLLGNLGV
jgi:hypothetical protein